MFLWKTLEKSRWLWLALFAISTTSLLARSKIEWKVRPDGEEFPFLSLKLIVRRNRVWGTLPFTVCRTPYHLPIVSLSLWQHRDLEKKVQKTYLNEEGQDTKAQLELSGDLKEVAEVSGPSWLTRHVFRNPIWVDTTLARGVDSPHTELAWSKTSSFQSEVCRHHEGH